MMVQIAVAISSVWNASKMNSITLIIAWEAVKLDMPWMYPRKDSWALLLQWV